jgi:DtxR family Mn-dependent transcriptional regulator
MEIRIMLEPLLALLGGIVLILVGLWFFRPDRGLLAKWQRSRQRSERILIEDTLKHIYNCEMAGDRPTINSIAGALQTSNKEAADLVAKIEAAEMVGRVGDRIHLTSAGRNSALHILRAHRLWERYLADTTGFSESEWHAQADIYEHHLSSEDTDALSAQLGYPSYDPHGDPIPSSNGDLVHHGGIPLTAAKFETPLRIVHIEDEPQTVYDQLVAEGLHPGMIVNVIEASSQRIRFWAEGDEHVLAPIIASNVSVVPIPEEKECETLPCEHLSELGPGEEAIVSGISLACRGLERRRLLDLGILPGTVIRAEFASPPGDPTAYRIRDTLIALRDEQAGLIHITRPEKEAA